MLSKEVNGTILPHESITRVLICLVLALSPQACNVWPVSCQTYDYLSSLRVSLPFDQY